MNFSRTTKWFSEWDHRRCSYTFNLGQLDKCKNYESFFIVPVNIYQEYKREILDLRIDSNLADRDSDPISFLNLLSGLEVTYDHELNSYKIPIVLCILHYDEKDRFVHIHIYPSMSASGGIYEEILNNVKIGIIEHEISNRLFYFNVEYDNDLDYDNMFLIYPTRHRSFVIFSITNLEDEDMTRQNNIIDIIGLDKDKKEYRLSYTKKDKFIIIKVNHRLDMSFQNYTKGLINKEIRKYDYADFGDVIEKIHVIFENNFDEVYISVSYR